MNHTRARRRLNFDRLEDKALLAAGTGSIPASALTFAHNFLPPADSQVLQTDASHTHLEEFASQIAQLTSGRADVQGVATQVMLDDMAAELQGHLLATNKDVVLPPDLIGNDVTMARQLLAAAYTANFDQTFLTTMVQSETAALANANQLATTTADTDVRTFAQNSAALIQTHLTAFQNVQKNAASGIGTGVAPAPTNTVTVSGADAAYLNSTHFSNSFEVFTSQITMLTTADTSTQRYAQKLVFDHRMAEDKVLQLANANGVSLLPVLRPDDAMMGRALLVAANSAQSGTSTGTGSGSTGSGSTGSTGSGSTASGSGSTGPASGSGSTGGTGSTGSGSGSTGGTGSTASAAYDRLYLSMQVPMHDMTEQTDIREASTTTNPNLREYARSDVATSEVHALAARQLQGAQTSALLPTGATAQDLNVRVRRINNFTYRVTANLNTGGFVYSTTTSVRFPRQSGGATLPTPSQAQVQQALFASLNDFLNGIAGTSGTSGSGTTTTMSAKRATK